MVLISGSQALMLGMKPVPDVGSEARP
jgi:hypothetical protein